MPNIPRPSRGFVIALVILALITALLGAALLYLRYGSRLGPDRAEQARAAHLARLERELEARGSQAGAPVYLRIFKLEKKLELWVEAGTEHVLFKEYPICTFSGQLGPKQKEGDGQSPEGFYEVHQAQLHPWSRYHLAFNLGFPNAFDRAQGYTGSFLMVHGDCVSIGCYAMGDRNIEEIYTLIERALDAGQPFVPLHIFPFRMTAQALKSHEEHRWIEFWRQLSPAYQMFAQTKRPPSIEVDAGRYVVKER